MGTHTHEASEIEISEPEARGTTRPGRPHLWVAIAALLVVVGVTGSVLAAWAVARSDADDSRHELERSSSAISSTLQLAIQHQEDLAVNTSALLATNPAATQPVFRALAESANVLDRYPDVLGFGFVVTVPAADLPAFVAQISSDPPGPLAADGSYQIVPAGDRPFYCLTKLGLIRDQQLFPTGADWCAGGAADPAQDSGMSTYSPVEIGATELLAVSVPVYRGGGVPTTPEARAEAFVGWVGTVSVPEVLLDRALVDHPDTAVTMGYSLNSSNAAFSSGQAPPGAESIAVDLQNGWTITTFAAVDDGGMFTGNALLVFLAGVALTVLLAALVLVLGTSRARALRLVEERTGELRHQALHDALTGLPNRALIMDRIDQLLARNRRNGTTGAALYVDLDDFKNVNDALGHEAGDRLLVAVSTRLTSTLRDVDTIGRMGGDEFVVLIDGAQLSIPPQLIAERLLHVMRRPFELDGASGPLTINATVGIAIDDRTSSGGDLLRDADVALYQAKAAGKDCFEVFVPRMQAEVVRRIELEFDLRSAIESDQFRLAYQPIYDLADLRIAGVEALLRWDHPTLGVIEPTEFIPILEETGQIQVVGRWVLRQACTQTAMWHSLGDTLDVSVNVSGRQLDHDAVVDHIREALDLSGLDATSLIVEVTETALMRNVAATAQRLHAIKELGVRIAVDDFGTGYSSLAYLQQFPVDCLKIDRSFTNAIATSPESRALIGTLVQLGRDLGLTTLAEGVETTNEFDHLRREHVNQIQGQLFSRPLDPEALETEILGPARLAHTNPP